MSDPDTDKPTIGEAETGMGHSPPAAPGLQRKLKARHIQMIAIGSNIGTGLFIGSGAALSRGGPLSLVLAFSLIGLTLFITMQCLTEMTVLYPVSGSFTRYATRFISPGMGFAIGWQYWLCWIAVFAAEATAANILIRYWTTDVHKAVWISAFVALNLSIHFFPVRVFAEVEFFVSSIKVISVIGFIIVTWAIMAGAGPTGRRHGGEYWVDPGPIANGFPGLASVFVTAAFACGGTETVGIVAGETYHPRINLPRAVTTLMWRILIFYITSLTFITFLVPSTHPDLLGASTNDASASPFVIAIKQAGIQILPDILNAVVLICVCSVGSVSIYISSRVLLALGEDNMAPKLFAQTDRQGRPRNAIIFSSLIASGLCYLNLSSTGAKVFTWFTSLSGMAFFLAWIVIIICNFRFRLAMQAQGLGEWKLARFAYTAKYWPYLPLFALTSLAFMVGCQCYVSLYPIKGPEGPDAESFFGGFLGVPIFLVMWLGWEVFGSRGGNMVQREGKNRAQKWWRWWIALDEVDLVTGRREEDPDEVSKLEEHESWGRRKRFMSYLRF